MAEQKPIIAISKSDIEACKKRFREYARQRSAKHAINLYEKTEDEFVKRKITEFTPEMIDAAVNLAYIDTQRTLIGISKKRDEKGNHPSISIKKSLKALLEGYFFKSACASSSDEFDYQHQQLCTAIGNAVDKHGYHIHYGQEQKIVNMTFKYLYCCNIGSELTRYFDYCHIPLDSYTLSGLKRGQLLPSEKQKKPNDALSKSWSKLDKDMYKAILEYEKLLTAKQVDHSKTTYDNLSFANLLDAELYIWEQESFIAAKADLEKAWKRFLEVYPGSTSDALEQAKELTRLLD